MVREWLERGMEVGGWVDEWRDGEMEGCLEEWRGWVGEWMARWIGR